MFVERRTLPRSSELRIAHLAFGNEVTPLSCLVWNVSPSSLLIEPLPENAVPAELRAIPACQRLDGPIRISRRAHGTFVVERLAGRDTDARIEAVRQPFRQPFRQPPIEPTIHHPRPSSRS